MILQDIINRVMMNTNNVYNNSHHIINMINNALNMLAGDAKLQAKQTISVVPGTGNYPLPATYKSPLSLIEGTIDNPLQVFTLVDIASPEYGYSIFNGEIVFKPTPARNVDVNFYFYAYPAKMVLASDPLTIDERYGDALAAYASAVVLSLPGTTETNKYLVDRYFESWDVAKSEFKRDMQLKIKQPTVRKVVQW